MIERGVLEDVLERPEGSSVTVDTALGAVLVPIEFDGDFDDNGGSAVIDGNVYAYTAITDDMELALDAGNPLLAAVDAGTEVLSLNALLQSESVWIAVVRIDPEDVEPVEAVIDTTMRNYFRLGDVDAGVLVEIEPRGNNRYRVVSRPVDPATFNGSFIDPTTLPDPVPIEAPTVSPALALTGIPGAIVARAETVAPSTKIEYHFWAAATGDTTYVPTQGDPATLFEDPTRSAVNILDHLPDGTALAEDTEYYAATIATNVAGSAPPSAAVAGQVDMSAVVAVVAAEVVAGFILAGEINVGSAYWNPNDGLVFPQPDGGEIRFPVDGVTAARITAHLVARSLTVEDNANFYGLTQLFGQLRLANGITNPNAKAGISDYLETHESPGLAGDFETIWWGLCSSHNSGKAMVGGALFGGTVREVDLTTYATDPFVFPNLGTFNPNGGITRLGSSYFMLGQDSARSNNWYIYKYNTSFVKQAELLFGTMTYRPAIGNDGTDVVLARIGQANKKPLVRKYNTSLTLTASDVEMNHVWPDDNGIRGVNWGTADHGATRIALLGFNAIKVFTTAGVRQSSEEWLPQGGSGRGMFYDGTRWWSLNDNGEIAKYTTKVGDQSIDGAYTWYDDQATGSTHESMIGPKATFTWKSRHGIVVVVPPAPEYGVASGTDLARTHKIYVGPAAGTLRLHSTLTFTDPATLSTILTALDTGSATPPASNGFDALVATPGRIESAAQNGSSVPHIKLEGNGQVRLAKFHQAGSFLTGTVVAGATNTNAVVFDTPFDAGQTLSATAWVHGDPRTFVCWSGNPSTTGVTISFVRVTGTGSFTVHWEVHVETQ